MILKQARKMIASNRNLNRLSAELKHSETVEHLILNELPYSLMWKIIDTLHARSNPGEIFRLGLVCKCLRHAIASYDSFWEQRILSLGWSFAHESSSSSSSTAGAAEEPEPSAGRLLGRQRAEAPTGSPFMRFAGRMQLRWQLRCGPTLALPCPFFPLPSIPAPSPLPQPTWTKDRSAGREGSRETGIACGSRSGSLGGLMSFAKRDIRAGSWPCDWTESAPARIIFWEGWMDGWMVE
eukprot:CAMPEP_0177626772 /NCGR_PEP_ID=MMETSP0419_2-20121207/30837_1 /TAXON_ID=582737 /ORGANISM="Tetraselmis sp., Strain GSL018" /LENGTH=237 /DNA_ID=CAMNT_0019127859 /DNA_START=173 /DNA_END=886 /DNA_ORIENTATION=-